MTFCCCFSPDSDFMTTLKLSSRRSRNAERQRGEIISEWCPYFHYHNEMTGEKKREKKTKNTNVVLVFCPVFPLRLMFLCDILWSGCCLRGGRSCCRLRWAAVGGGSCVAGSRLLLLSLFGKFALVCVLNLRPSRKKKDASRLTSFILLRWKSHTPLSTFKQRSEKQRGRHQTMAFLNVPERKRRPRPDLPPHAADSYLGVLICLLFIAGC